VKGIKTWDVPNEPIYRAYHLTPPDKVKVVILGQDPYPTKGHANGLAFSVHPHVKPLPPSLRNIFREYQDDLGYDQPRHGDLTPWAERGVLLINTALEVGKFKQWERFTYDKLRRLSGMRRGIVFILWGAKAQEYAALIDVAHNDVLQAPHPSPLSARTGFFGSKPFTTANKLRVSGQLEPVDWKLP
jgi:uracil-DNA glycosylase